jgi:phage-related protein (TIGR01555 family)
MVYESNIDTFKIKGLMSYLQTSDGESKLLKRLTLSGLTKSINNALIIDAEEEYDSKSKSFAGLPELIDRFSLFLSAATDIPATRLLGSSASGFNATGEGDLRNYYDTVRSAQKKVYKPILDYLDKIIAKSLGLSEDADLSYEFNSLFQESAVEKADRELKEAQKHQIYLSGGVVTEEIIAKELVQNRSYTNIDDEHLEALGSYDDGEFGPDTDEAELRTEQETQERREEANTAGNESKIS